MRQNHQKFVNDTGHAATFELTNSKNQPIATFDLKPGQAGDALLSDTDANAKSNREVELGSDGRPLKKFGESNTQEGPDGAVQEANDVSNIDNNDPNAI